MPRHSPYALISFTFCIERIICCSIFYPTYLLLSLKFVVTSRSFFLYSIYSVFKMLLKNTYFSILKIEQWLFPWTNLRIWFLWRNHFSLERRWSSRTFRYGYLVTTSPQSSIPPSMAPSLRLDYQLRVLPTPMVWRAVCTRPGNVFTAAFWSAITSNSDFMQASCSLQSELRQFLGFRSASLLCIPLLIAIVVRV